MRKIVLALVLTGLSLASGHVFANDVVKVASAQKGFWDTTILLYGERAGLFKAQGSTSK